jgi:hypothetical protein
VSSDLQGQIGSSLTAGYPPPLGAAPGAEELQLPFDRVEGEASQQASPGGGADADGGDAGADGADDDEAVAGEVVDAGGDDAVAVNGEVVDAFAELRAIWDRGHVKDGRPEQIAADRRAFAAARQHASDDNILAGARAWRQAYSPPHSAPHFLPPLADWLAQCRWATSPPERRSKSKRNGNGQYRNGHYRGNGKFDAVGYALRYTGVIKDDESDENLGGVQ